MKFKRFYIGIMSGTSMDGVDAVLIEMQGTTWLSALAHSFIPYPDSLKERLLELQHVSENELHRCHLLATELSHLYAEAANNLLRKTKLTPRHITAIGCHGQTVRHAPEFGYSVQLANLPLLAELTGILTVGDFRSRDLAAGGQGAPLVPVFHHALFSDPEETRIVLNIGGIANISILNDKPFGFDTGPGNMLMDAWVQYNWQHAYDKNGMRAARGHVLLDLLAELKAHDYFKLPYPKSTGRELFSLDWLYGYLHGNEEPFDVLRTLLQFTTDTIVDAIVDAAPNAKNVYICGGGSYNPTLMRCLQTELAERNMQCYTTDILNLNPQWVEAAAFAWLAACWSLRVPINVHYATGAKHPSILGAGYYA